MRILSEARLAAVLGVLPGVPRVVAGGNFATPWHALAVLDSAIGEYQLFMLNAQAGLPDRDGVTFETAFAGPGMRGHERLRYFPCRLSLVAVLLSGALPPDIVLLHTSAPADGNVSLGTEVNILPAAIEAARARGGLVIAQLNPHVPYTYGDAVVAADEVDYAIEAEALLPAPPARQSSEGSALIGERVAELVPEAATLQVGIGATPEAFLGALTGRRGLRVWSEMFSDGVLGLEKAGALDPGCPVIASFAFRQSGAVRVDGPQPGRGDAAHLVGQRPGADCPAPAGGLGQYRASGRPVRGGEREPGARPGLFRFRRADRFRRRCAAFP